MRVIWIAIVILFMSCDGKPDIYAVPEEPADLLSQEKFTQVLMEMQLLEATLKLKLIRKNDIQERIPGYFEEVFEKFEVTEEQFRSSLAFYNGQPLKTTEIYDSIEQRLVRMKESIDHSPLNQEKKKGLDKEDIINDQDTLEKKRKRSLLLDPQYEK